MPRFVLCSGCGVSVDRGTRTAHRCATDGLVEQCLDLLRGEVHALEEDLGHWLGTAGGRSQTRWAAREVRRPRP